MLSTGGQPGLWSEFGVNQRYLAGPLKISPADDCTNGPVMKVKVVCPESMKLPTDVSI